jgi:uncharacterized protein YndB with AHSA1/START domain
MPDAKTERSLTLSRAIAARPETVWRCLTEPTLLCQWFAPRPVTVIEVRLDPRPGGEFYLNMLIPDHGESGGHPGCILVADPARRLVWTNALAPEFVPIVIGTGPMDFAFTADIRLVPTATGCTYDVRVSHATTEAAAKHEKMGFHEGWGTCADQLADLARDLDT